MALLTKGTVWEAGVDFEDVDFVVLDGELDVHEAADFEFEGEQFCLSGDLFEDVGLDRHGGSEQALSPE